MIARLVRIACLAFAATCGLASAQPEAFDMERPPYDAIRALHAVQEQIAHGNKAALASQPKLMASVSTRFLAVDPAVWRDTRNARAAVMYLFSGGQASVIRTILSRSTMPRDIDRLLKGALAYAEGQDKIARDLLDPIDPRAMPSILGGHLALVEATLFAETDKVKAGKLLDLARLLVPGTLVEEAALRRQISLDADPVTMSRFIFLSREYLHRFKTSIYAENFKQHFAAMAVKIAAGGDVAQLGMLDVAITELQPADQRALYLLIAKTAIVQGKTEAARFAAERAAMIAKDSTGDALRAQLYINAAAIVSTDVVKGIAALEAADRSRLSPDDADLRDAAIAVARSVASPVPDLAGGDAFATANDDPASATLVDQANKAIASGDKLLEDGTK